MRWRNADGRCFNELGSALEWAISPDSCPAAVVRALINEPALVLADEPTGALDQTSGAEVAQLLVDLNRESGVTLIVVTHNPELAARMGRRIELKSGHLVEVLP